LSFAAAEPTNDANSIKVAGTLKLAIWAERRILLAVPVSRFGDRYFWSTICAKSLAVLRDGNQVGDSKAPCASRMPKRLTSACSDPARFAIVNSFQSGADKGFAMAKPSSIFTVLPEGKAGLAELFSVDLKEAVCTSICSSVDGTTPRDDPRVLRFTY